MAIEVSYFAWVRERMGCSGETLDLPASVSTIGMLIDWLAARDAAGALAFAEPGRIRAAVDGQMCGPATVIDGARDVALFPPVTGG